MEKIHLAMARSGLIRPESNRWIGGVCAGVASRMGVDANAVRLVFALLIFLPGSQLIVYPLLWLFMPDTRRATELGITPGSRVTPPVSGPQDRTPGM